MIRPQNETEDLLLSITKKCETLIAQTHRKTEETLKFGMTEPRKTFYLSPGIQIKGHWMIGLTSLEICSSIFDITEENNKFEIYTGVLEDEFSYTQLKDKAAEVFGLSDISPQDLELELVGQDIIKIYRKLSTEKNQTDRY